MAERFIQEDFSAGMFPALPPERIPANGAQDITNGILSDTGEVSLRGGGGKFIQFLAGKPRLLWAGYLGGTYRELIITSSRIYMDAGLTDVGAYTGMATRPLSVAVLNDVMYLPGGYTFNGTTLTSGATSGAHVAAVANRILLGNGDTVKFSGIFATGAPAFAATDFHKFPEGTQVTGIMPLRDRAAVFTTQGLWLISNLASNLTDAAGNVQQHLDQYSPNLWLWNDSEAGVAAYGDALIVPGLDGVWLVSLGIASEAAQPQQLISKPIETLYRSYMVGGYVPGQATVFANHYLLPILSSGGTVVDVLVCKLDATNSRGQRTFSWTHFQGSSLPAAVNPAPFAGSSWGLGVFLHGLFATAASTTAAGGLEYFGPDPQGTRHVTDPDLSVYRLDVTTRSIAVGVRSTFLKLKVTYRMSSGAGTATLTAEQAPGPTAAFAALNGAAPENAAGVDPYTWPVGKASRSMRFRLRSGLATAPTEVSLRALDIRTRQSGRV